ncbi:response regulator [uncultured Amnibacterium sp.]|uniref:response regulator n=1 Tax=uncultured Amnibacterium sp. TaxID=1631851 RepID=UPI0035CC34F8
MKILAADDDPQILKALRIILAAHGYEVVTARDGREAIQAAAHDLPDLILLDLGMPGIGGVAVIEAVRGWSSMPILVVSGRSDTAGKVDALDAGANDYVVKPFATEELLARIRALTRRSPESAAAPTVAFGEVVVDLPARQVKRAGVDVRLTPTEWAVLEQLIRNPRRLVTQQTLLTSVWGPAHTRDSGYLRIYLAALRKKLEPVPAQPRYLITEPGIGYRFVPEGD